MITPLWGGGALPAKGFPPRNITIFAAPGTSSIPPEILDSGSMPGPGIGFLLETLVLASSWCDTDFLDSAPLNASR